MKKIGVVLGGMSTEHDVSIISGTSVINNLSKEKYKIYPIYIDQNGIWYEYLYNVNKSQFIHSIDKIKIIENVFSYLKNLDVIFPVLHGKYGEDGSIQGIFEIINVPYVGCKILASSLGMDKVYSKIIFDRAGIKQSKYCYLKKIKNEYIYVNKDLSEIKLKLVDISKKIEENFAYPIFIKPSNGGSSIGINKVNNKIELKEAIEYASRYDEKIIVEEEIRGREIECAILGNEDPVASKPGEIIPGEEFYSYNAKYKNSESKIIIPAQIGMTEEIQKLAIKAFKAIDGRGLARVDFFVTKDDIYINEINTIPGFTNISMYAKLWKEAGIEYEQLLDKLIELAM